MKRSASIPPAHDTLDPRYDMDRRAIQDLDRMTKRPVAKVKKVKLCRKCKQPTMRGPKAQLCISCEGHPGERR